jgi:tryptophan halogenase
MQASPIETVVIVGGGTAGWMSAVALASVLRGRCKIRLVESDEIGIVGVGEATIPMFARFNAVAGIDENAMLRATQGTFKLGIEFVNWGRVGERYMHGFGGIGQDMGTLRFFQFWRKMRALGKAGPLDDYAITRAAAYANKFMPAPPDRPNSPLGAIAHAYHFDASLYARYLRTLGEQRGVERTEGKICRISRRASDGHVDAVVLESGQRIEGELFIDCSGFRALLIEGALETGYEDWSGYLPCDRALAVPCKSVERLTPYTRSTAHQAGWQWRIPLQHRTGNGHVYCSSFISDDEAHAVLLANLDGAALAEPRMVKFTTGMRKQGWNKNVVAIGLSSGFLEPLESTSIHMIQSSIARLIEFFPDRSWQQAGVDEYNRQSRFEYERIRDFIILHYKLNQRDDAPFWQQCAAMQIPDTLRYKMDLFRAHGKVVRTDNELFTEIGWLQVMLGQNLEPDNYHPLVDTFSQTEVAELVDNVAAITAKCVEVMPEHAAYIRQFCQSPRR